MTYTVRPRFSLYCFLIVAVGIFNPLAVRPNLQSSGNSVQQSDPKRQGAILKAREPLEIVGTVVAMTQETVDVANEGYAHILLLKIESIQTGKDPGRYVRADFANHQIKYDPKYERLFSSFHEDKKWKIHLRPPDGRPECSWPIPTPLRPEELSASPYPVLAPLHGAMGFPDINTLPCYAFEVKDIEEVLLPGNGKK